MIVLEMKYHNILRDVRGTIMIVLKMSEKLS